MLKEIREKAGLTQAQLAGAAGVTVYTVRKWEQHGTATAYAGMLKRVADALGCRIEDLL